MAFSTIDPVTGVIRYNPLWIVAIALAVSALLGGLVWFFVRDSAGFFHVPFGVSAPVTKSSRARLDSIAEGRNPSREDHIRDASDYFDSVSAVAGESKQAFLDRAADPTIGLTNMDSRFGWLFPQEEKVPGAGVSGSDGQAAGNPVADAGRRFSDGRSGGSGSGGYNVPGLTSREAGGFAGAGAGGFGGREGAPGAAGRGGVSGVEGSFGANDAAGDFGHEGFFQGAPEGAGQAGAPGRDGMSGQSGSGILGYSSDSSGSAGADGLGGAGFSGGTGAGQGSGSEGTGLMDEVLLRDRNARAGASAGGRAVSDARDDDYFAERDRQRSNNAGSAAAASDRYVVAPKAWFGPGAGETGSGTDVTAASALRSDLETMRASLKGKLDLLQAPQGPPAPEGASGLPVPAPEVYKLSANSVPTGTRLAVCLVNNVISSSLDQRVWAVTTQELVFRRQVQLPRGVMLGGSTGGSPVRNQLDVVFDLMVFPDGTELPISGFAVNAYNPLYPGVEGMRGLVDLYIEPPEIQQWLPILLEAVSGYTNVAFAEGTVVRSETGVPMVDPRVQFNKAINSSVAMMKSRIFSYLEKYTPYVHLRKGMPFYVEVMSTVDFSKRQLGGVTYEGLVKTTREREERALQALQAGWSPAAFDSASLPSARQYLGVSSSQEFRRALQMAEAVK
ncbi:hypothetical protein OH491_23930 [Termitidicoccus mucosus]|uniref:Uncharacterized protein n=1 Tax=Termitidicoccus mucosus TaxID=1184151 RepID=A0A178INT5_9BACT|nr:hypothetical protein AW736_02565 [Opitutaceae bacterium TSB47]